MTTLRTAAQQALEALEIFATDEMPEGWQAIGAITALKAALAEPVWVKGELPPPYVERSPIQAEPPTDWEAVAADQAMTIALMKAEPAQEPVAWMVYTLDGKSVCVTDNPADFTDEHRVLPLYTAPPQRKPLTEEEILSISVECSASHQQDDVQFARAIEHAHGIKDA